MKVAISMFGMAFKIVGGAWPLNPPYLRLWAEDNGL